MPQPIIEVLCMLAFFGLVYLIVIFCVCREMTGIWNGFRYRFLSIKAAASDTNLKSYIEALLEKEVEDMNEDRSSMTACSSNTLSQEAKPMTRNTRRN